MPFQWPVDLDALFDERQPQMTNRGLPAEDVAVMRERINEMWANEPGGWVYEWSELADRYLSADQTSLALLALGYAKFPTLADAHRKAAHERQIELCRKMGAGQDVVFSRREIALSVSGNEVTQVVHQYSAADGDTGSAPLVLASGGVDMWKEDLHSLWSAIAGITGFSVLAFDVPGTGESPVALSSSSHQIVSGLVEEARRLGNGQVAHLGISMGGYFAARTGITGEVDAAVDLGGPVRSAFDVTNPTTGRGAMKGILGSALGFDSLPDAEALTARWHPLSLAQVLEENEASTPMLVINGAEDALVPQEDTLLFQDRKHCEVHLYPDCSHCAPEKMAEIIPMVIAWLSVTLNQ